MPEKFGRWVVIGEPFLKRSGKQGRTYIKVRCMCGTVRNIRYSTLVTRKSKSCGCLARELSSVRRKHGLSTHRFYDTWTGIMARCYNPRHMYYANYGGRGIEVCQSWQDVTNFITWAVKQPFETGFTLDRRNNNGNYAPSNCRFVSRIIQNRNSRSNVLYFYRGKLRTIAELIELAPVSMTYETLYARLNRAKWPMNKALTTLVR